MKHCFIINPASGKVTTKDGLEGRIRESCDSNGAECFVYMTEERGDAQKYIASFCAEHEGDSIRFYACGGDGTLCEVVNGVMAIDNRENISVGVIPVGTGNDFVRNFSPKELFLDIDAQLSGTPVKIDLIRCNDFYAMNMINIGFDCQVVVKTAKIKRKKWIPSKMAYICGLVATLVKKPGVNVSIGADGAEAEKKELLLTTFANGEFCGGGFHSNPHAELCDGMINALLVNDIPRTKFLTLVGSYKSGTHLEGKYDDILGEVKKQCFTLTFDAPTEISVDGEIFTVDGGVDISCEKGALSFIVPKGTVGNTLEKSMAAGERTVTV